MTISPTNNQIKYIYILLTDTGTLFNKAIKAYTENPYNHASLSLNEELTDLYSFGRKHPRNPLYAGFVKEDFIHGTYAFFPKTKCSVYRMKVDAKTYNHIKKIVQHFEKHKNHYTYNLTGVLGITVNYPVQRKTSYFCSQFVAHVLLQANVPINHKKTGLVTPEDFRLSPQLELIFEGNLFNYPPVAHSIEKSEFLKKNRFYQRILFDQEGKFRLFKSI